MKKIFVTLTAIFIATSGMFVEAAPISNEQLNKIFLTETPATASTFNLNAETLKKNFNGIITPILKEATGTDDVSAMAHLFLIKEYQIFGKANGDTFAHIFGDYRVALVGLSESNGGKCKSLSLYYTTPEDRDEAIFTIWLMTAFVKSFAPDVDVQALMSELTAENSSAATIKGNIKFSVTAEDNLNVLTATPVK